MSQFSFCAPFCFHILDTVIAGRISQEYTEQVVSFFSPPRLTVHYIQLNKDLPMMCDINVQLSITY